MNTYKITTHESSKWVSVQKNGNFFCLCMSKDEAERVMNADKVKEINYNYATINKRT